MIVARGAALIWAIMVLNCSARAAQACNPIDFLQHDTENIQIENKLHFSYLEDQIEKTKKSRNRQGSVGFGGFSLSYGDAEKLAQYARKTLQLNLQSEERVSVVRSTLSPAGLEAYKACVAKRAVWIEVPKESSNEEVFHATVKWAPRNEIVSLSTPISLVISNGRILDGLVNGEMIKVNESRAFVVSRDPKRSLYLSITINGETDTLILPKVPHGDIGLKPAYSNFKEICRSGHCGPTLVNEDVCIVADPGSILLPDTADISDLKVIGDPKRAYAKVSSRTEHKVCATFTNSSGCTGNRPRCYNFIRGRLMVLQATKH